MIRVYIQLYLTKAVAAILLATICTLPCSASNNELPLHPPPIIAHYNTNNIEVTILQTPPKLDLINDIFLKIIIKAPLGTTVTVPALPDYCIGFKLMSEFDTPLITKNNITIYTRNIHLQPKISPLYSIKPFSIRYRNRSYNPAVTGSIDIAEITFSPALQTLPAGNNDIITDFSPIQSPTSAQKRNAGIIAILLFITIIILQIRRSNRNNKNINDPTLSARTIALQDLEKLLKSNLISQEKFTEFYFALTDIVRQYIEAILKIQSTHQTSKELLDNLHKDNRISADTISDLKQFLQRADLVKFATLTPSTAELANDIAWAKKYIESNIIETEKDNEETISC